MSNFELVEIPFGSADFQSTLEDEFLLAKLTKEIEAVRDIEQLRDDLTQGIEHFFQFAFYVTIYDSDIKELDQMTEDLENK
jgi:type IV secretory pathway VirB4 component